MNRYEKSTAIKSGLRKGFREGSSKLAGRKCYGYDTDTDGSLTINQDEAQVVHWIFERYAAGDSLWNSSPTRTSSAAPDWWVGGRPRAASG